MQQKADMRLARRLMKGDSRTFDAFFNGYFPRIYRFALARLGQDHDLAEETAQQVLCQAISKMASYRGEAPLFSWLCTFARHEISKQHRARRKAQGDVVLVEDDPAVRAALESLLAETGSDPGTLAQREQVQRLVKVALDYLPALYAEVLERKYAHGDAVREIARRLGKSEKATESTLTRARQAFRDAFASLVSEALDGTNSELTI